ncbi:MAG TPA: hypothetical protein VF736_08075 [Pyrinomonadaceae bacterium]
MTRARPIAALAFAAAAAMLGADASAHPAWGVAVDREGRVYFSDLERVWKLDARGALTLLRDGRGAHQHEINVDADGNLYGAENSYDPSTRRFFSAVWRITPAGDFSYLLPPTDDPPEGTSIWKDGAGNAYHVTHFPGRELLILKRTPGGEVRALVGGDSAAREYRQGVPYGVGGTAFGPDGSLYFTHGASLGRLGADGRLTELARDLPTGGSPAAPPAHSTLLGVAVDARGVAYVADYGGRRVLKVAPDGKLTTLLRAEETWFPAGVAEKGGELYVLEHSVTPAYVPLGTRVRRLSPDGAVTTLAAVDANGRPRAAPTPSPAAAPTSRPREPARRLPYALLGAGAALLAIFVAAWFVRARGGNGSPP